MNPKAIFGLLRDSFKEWSEDKASRLGAALAYYTIFSMGPLLIISRLRIASLVFANAKDQIVGQISSVVGTQGGEAIKQTIENNNKGGGSIIATIVGIVYWLARRASSGSSKDALNTIWESKPKPAQRNIGDGQGPFPVVYDGAWHGLPVARFAGYQCGRGGVGQMAQQLPAGRGLVGRIVNLVLILAVVTVMFALL